MDFNALEDGDFCSSLELHNFCHYFLECYWITNSAEHFCSDRDFVLLWCSEKKSKTEILWLALNYDVLIWVINQDLERMFDPTTGRCCCPMGELSSHPSLLAMVMFDPMTGRCCCPMLELSSHPSLLAMVKLSAKFPTGLHSQSFFDTVINEMCIFQLFMKPAKKYSAVGSWSDCWSWCWRVVTTWTEVSGEMHWDSSQPRWTRWWTRGPVPASKSPCYITWWTHWRRRCVDLLQWLF